MKRRILRILMSVAVLAIFSTNASAFKVTMNSGATSYPSTGKWGGYNWNTATYTFDYSTRAITFALTEFDEATDGDTVTISLQRSGMGNAPLGWTADNVTAYYGAGASAINDVLTTSDFVAGAKTVTFDLPLGMLPVSETADYVDGYKWLFQIKGDASDTTYVNYIIDVTEEIAVPSFSVVAGSGVNLNNIQIEGSYQFATELAPQGESIVWSLGDGGTAAASISADGLLEPTTIGSLEVIATASTLADTLKVTVIDIPASPEDTLLYSNWMPKSDFEGWVFKTVYTADSILPTSYALSGVGNEVKYMMHSGNGGLKLNNANKSNVNLWISYDVQGLTVGDKYVIKSVLTSQNLAATEFCQIAMASGDSYPSEAITSTQTAKYNIVQGPAENECRDTVQVTNSSMTFAIGVRRIKNNQFLLNTWSVIKIQDQGVPTGIESVSTSLKLYPNPTNHTITLKGLEQDAMLQVYNTSGRCVIQSNLNNNSLNVSALDAGVYFVRCQNEMIKFIKQ